MIENILIVLIAFLGLVFGILFSRLAKEEIKPGEKYFKILEKIILFILVIALLYYAWNNLLLTIIGFIIGIFVSSIFKIKYFYLGFAMMLGFLVSKEFSLIIASLILLYGLPYGSREFFNKKFMDKVFLYFLFFIIPFVFLFFGFVNNNLYLFLAFVAGALFNFLIQKE